MVERFAVLSLPRSGTNYFLSKIAPLNGVLAAWEPFNTRMTQWFDQTSTLRGLPESSARLLNDTKHRDSDPQGFFHAVFSPSASVALPGVKALGFKMFPQHNCDLFWKVSKIASVKIIVIERTNKLDCFVSYIAAASTDRWIGNNDFLKSKYHFSAEFFETYCAFSDSVYSGLRSNIEANKIPYLYIDYDAMVSNEGCFIEFCDFVGVQYEKVATNLKKQITFKAADLFFNKEYVERYIKEKYPQYWKS